MNDSLINNWMIGIELLLLYVLYWCQEYLSMHLMFIMKGLV